MPGWHRTGRARNCSPVRSCSTDQSIRRLLVEVIQAGATAGVCPVEVLLEALDECASTLPEDLPSRIRSPLEPHDIPVRAASPTFPATGRIAVSDGSVRRRSRRSAAVARRCRRQSHARWRRSPKRFVRTVAEARHLLFPLVEAARAAPDDRVPPLFAVSGRQDLNLRPLDPQRRPKTPPTRETADPQVSAVQFEDVQRTSTQPDADRCSRLAPEVLVNESHPEARVCRQETVGQADSRMTRRAISSTC